MANARPFRALRKLSAEERVRALGRIEAGIHPQDVANQFNVHRSTIIRLRDHHRASGLFLADPVLDDRKLQPSIKTDTCTCTLQSL